MRFACWIPKATNTHSEYVILLAFPQQQWLRKSASMLRYMYTACLADSVLLNATVYRTDYMSPVISRDKLHYTDGKRRLTREKVVPEPLCPPQI